MKTIWSDVCSTSPDHLGSCPRIGANRFYLHPLNTSKVSYVVVGYYYAVALSALSIALIISSSSGLPAIKAGLSVNVLLNS